MKYLTNSLKNITIENKNKIKKLILVLSIFSLLVTLITGFFTLEGIIKIIVISAIAIIQFIFLIKIILIIKNQKDEKNENFEIKYDPLLTYFLKNQTMDNVKNIDKLIFSELMDLSRRGYIEIIEKDNDEIFKLKAKDKFIRMNGLENIDKKQIELYSSAEIPAYENLFVTKILFPFDDEISRSDISKKIREGYYAERMEMCAFAMEKMFVYFLEKNNMVISENSFNMFVGILSINIVITLFEFIMMETFNILLLLSNVIAIILDILLLKNEKIFSYRFSDDVSIYIRNLEKYMDSISNLEKESLSQKDEIMLELFK